MSTLYYCVYLRVSVLFCMLQKLSCIQIKAEKKCNCATLLEHIANEMCIIYVYLVQNTNIQYFTAYCCWWKWH